MAAVSMRIPVSLLLVFTASAAPAFAQDLVRVPAGRYEVTDQVTTLKLSISVSASTTHGRAGTTSTQPARYPSFRATPSTSAIATTTRDTRLRPKRSWWRSTGWTIS